MAGLSSKASDTILSSYRVQLPFGPGSAPGALPIALPRLDNLPGLRDEPDACRKRLWELDPTLHCSIIGTCLSQGELREILRRIARSEGLVVATPSDHELHSLGVRLAERRDGRANCCTRRWTGATPLPSRPLPRQETRARSKQSGRLHSRRAPFPADIGRC